MKYSGSSVITKIFQLIKSKFDGLAAVATSGSYNDLTDTPDIVRATSSITEDNTTAITIPITITDVSNLTVYQNGLLLTPDVHYTATTSAITLVGYTANSGDIFTFVGSNVTAAVDMPSVSSDYELVFQETIAQDVQTYSRDKDKDGNPFSLTDVMVIIFTKPFAESLNEFGRALGFLPTSVWGKDSVIGLSNTIKSGGSDVGRYDMVYVKLINGYQICDRYYRSQNTTNVFGVMQEVVAAGATGIQFHTDATKIMEISRPQGNITCVKIVGYTNPLVSAGTIVALYKKKGT